MEHKSQISIINVTRSFQEGDRADTYRDLVVQGTCFNPDRHRVETITRSELMTPEAVWQKLLKSKLLASSGSNDNVGEPLKGPEADLEPNLESAVVRNLVSVYQFLVLKTHQGDDPSLRELHGILNCFSAQALSYAIMLVVCLVRRKADLSKVHDIRDMMQKYPIEEISADPQFRFPLRKACASQVGVLPVEILDSHHWAVQGLPQQPNMLFLHNQTILSEVLQEAVGVIRTVQIFAERKLKVFHRGRQERKTIVTGFSVGNLTALQAHVDYGDHPATFAAMLERGQQEKNTQGKSYFYPGSGGATSSGDPVSMEELIHRLRAVSPEDHHGPILKRRIFERALQHVS